ncbi:hypothetical protein NHJ13734_009275 [Beauveria thailandica]
MAPPQQPSSDAAAFFEQIMGMDPNRFSGTSRGVDHSGPNYTSYPTFWPGFPFGRAPHPPPHPGPPSSDHPRPTSPPGPPGHGSVPAPPPGPGRHGRHRHHHSPGAWAWGGRGGGGWTADDGDFYFSDDYHRGDYWGGRGYGRYGRHGRGRRHHHDNDEGTRDRPVSVPDQEKNTGMSDEKKGNASGDEKNVSPDTVRDDVPDPDEIVPEYEEAGNHHHSEPFTGGFGGFGGFGRGCGGGRRGRDGRRGSHSRRSHHDRSGLPFDTTAPGAGPNSTFSFPDMMRGLMSHPFVQQMGAAAARGFNVDNNTTENHDDDDADSFSPPVDLFNTPRAYVLHVALPGAKREDVGVHWDPEHGTLSVTGVVHRPGDEAFLQSLYTAERRVGVFSKKVVLPPRDLGAAREQQLKEDVDADGIAAKLDDGVLVIMVPKVEKEWTEVRKVDIL